MRALARPLTRHLAGVEGTDTPEGIRGAANALLDVASDMERMQGIYTAGSIGLTIDAIAREYRQYARTAQGESDRLECKGAALAFEVLSEDIMRLEGKHGLLMIGVALRMRSRTYRKLLQDRGWEAA